MKKEIYKNCPDIVRTILIISGGWLIGSAPEKLSKGEPVKDYDIICPSRELYQKTCLAIKDKGTIQFNSFGGLKFKIDDLIIDFWPEELDHFIRTANRFDYAYCLVGAKLIQQI